jgi:beta-N-acetylhexosaminidase
VGLRSFGEDPAVVARLGRAAIRGYRKGGLLAVAKHFPGHGDTSEDSHLGLPVSTKTLAELEAVELVPFRAAFAAGAAAIMPAHMVFPALGTGPAQSITLSSAATTDFLRGRLKFGGLIFSDSLDMGAIANVRGSSQAAIGALEGGADVLLLGKADFPTAFAALIDAVKSGRVPRARLERSVARVLEAKRRYGLFGREAPGPLGDKLLERHRALARRAAESAVTVVLNKRLLPLRLKPDQTLGLVLLHSTRYNEESAFFAAEIARRHPRAVVADVPALYPSTTAVQAALDKVAGASIVIVGTYQFGLPTSPNAALLIRRLIDGPSPVVAVSLMNPYDLSLSTGASAAVCAYGMTTSSLEAAARLLFGEIPARGRLPVSVPGVAARGGGLRSKPAGGPIR